MSQALLPWMHVIWHLILWKVTSNWMEVGLAWKSTEIWKQKQPLRSTAWTISYASITVLKASLDQKPRFKWLNFHIYSMFQQLFTHIFKHNGGAVQAVLFISFQSYLSKLRATFQSFGHMRRFPSAVLFSGQFLFQMIHTFLALFKAYDPPSLVASSLNYLMELLISLLCSSSTWMDWYNLLKGATFSDLTENAITLTKTRLRQKLITASHSRLTTGYIKFVSVEELLVLGFRRLAVKSVFDSTKIWPTFKPTMRALKWTRCTNWNFEKKVSRLEIEKYIY